MHIEDAIVAYLIGLPAISALISNRIFPEEVPQKQSLPAVTYILISDSKIHTLTEQLNIERPNYQLTVYALTKAGARAVADQIKIALVDYQGSLSGVTIQKIELQTEMTSLEKSADGTLQIYTHDLEFEITFEKA
jgi:hypothetical protein